MPARTWPPPRGNDAAPPQQIHRPAVLLPTKPVDIQRAQSISGAGQRRGLALLLPAATTQTSLPNVNGARGGKITPSKRYSWTEKRSLYGLTRTIERFSDLRPRSAKRTCLHHPTSHVPVRLNSCPGNGAQIGQDVLGRQICVLGIDRCGNIFRLPRMIYRLPLPCRRIRRTRICTVTSRVGRFHLMNQVVPRLSAPDQWVRSARITCRSVSFDQSHLA
jgi:hypothetical protein